MVKRKNEQPKKKKEKQTEKQSITEGELGVDKKWGWFVVFNSFICNMIVDGIQYTFANFLMAIMATFSAQPASVSLIGSLLSGFYNFSGPIGSALGNKFGFRMVVIIGSLISASGLMISYFAPSVLTLYFTYGILGGLGFGMIYMASVITTSMYFEKYRALAVSLTVCGTGVGTFAFSPFGGFLVDAYGWRYALVVEGGLLLLCILCALSFKPLKLIAMVPVGVSKSESLISVTTHGSVFFPSERRKPKPNEAYPTFKEVLEEIDEKAETPSAASADPSSVPRIFSMISANYLGEPAVEKKNWKWKFQICCFNFWHCRCKKEDLTLGDRPLYRDDIFYPASLTSLEPYTSSSKFDYHLKVTRIPDVTEVEQHMERKCCTCHHAFFRALVTMTGLNLLKSKVFVFLVISCFFYTMSLYIPYVFVKKLGMDNDVPDEQGVWLVSSMGISNTAGRLLSGIMKNFTKINAALFSFGCLMFSGIITFIFIIRIDMVTLAVYSCFFGLLTAPFTSLRPVIIVDFLGLEKLTNAFGLMLLGQGIASIVGPPIAGLIESTWGDCVWAIYFAGVLMILSGMTLLLSTFLNFREKKKHG